MSGVLNFGCYVKIRLSTPGMKSIRNVKGGVPKSLLATSWAQACTTKDDHV